MSSRNSNKIVRLRALRNVDICKIKQMEKLAEEVLVDGSLIPGFLFAAKDYEAINTSFNNQHTELINLIAVEEDANLDTEEIIRFEFANSINKIASLYFKHNSLLNNTTSGTQNVSADPQIKSKRNVNLPKLNLSIFAGEITDFPTFIDLYNALVHNNSDLSNIEKFSYLLQSLKGVPYNLIKSIKLQDSNYIIAYNTLIDRYEGKRDLSRALWKNIQNASVVKTDDPVSLRKLLDIFNENLASLEKLLFSPAQWDFILMNLLMDKLDVETVRAFELHFASKNVPSYEEVYKFALQRCTSLESYKRQVSKNVKSTSSDTSNNVRYSSRQTSTFLTSSVKNKCLFCGSDHALFKCNQFLAESPQKRFDFAKQNKCCINCLSKTHVTIKCLSSKRCTHCNKKHHTALHFDNLNANDHSSSSSHNEVASSSNDPMPSVSALSNTLTNNVLLATATIYVLDRFGKALEVRALLDSASQANFISKECADKLSLPKLNAALSIQGLDRMCTPAKSGVKLNISSSYDINFHCEIDAIILPQICQNMPTVPISLDNLPYLQHLRLADKMANIPGKVDVLLGANIFPYILTGGIIKTRNDQLSALETSFGYVLMGNIPPTNITNIHSFFTSFSANDSEQLDATLKRFWAIEEVPEVKSYSPEDSFCEKLYTQTTCRNSEGRFVVKLPFKNEIPSFGDTKRLALQRFSSLERRFAKNESLKIQYSSFIKSFIDNHYLNPIQPSTAINNAYYLPHHCIYKESSTTPLRVVFDASAHAPNFPSLNDTLYSGPKLQNDLVNLLLKFRFHKYVFTADIKSMFTQILIAPGQ
ncbi:uncharacterized protein [Diabrotica undecimpunctata]|uniref:uncharacterized protein isoform X1 n=1 Tax=Diabrotica undecimpunctata TaxID=50387 RepID=UPI003B63C87D